LVLKKITISIVKNFKIKSYGKINLTLNVINKLNNSYHSISSLITFCDLHDLINISAIKSPNDKIVFSGRFKKGINNKSNTVAKLLSLLREKGLLKKQSFRINIKKNIPHGSGLGGGSSNAANLLNFLNNKMKLNLNNSEKLKIARQIGFDVPINLKRKNTILTGKKDEILRMNKGFKLHILIVYPNFICSTKKIYKNNKKIGARKIKYFLKKLNKKNLISALKKERNDLQSTVIKIYPKIAKVINFIKSQNGCHLSRITGSGSACIGIFSNIHNAIYAQKSIRSKYPKFWSVVSRTI